MFGKQVDIENSTLSGGLAANRSGAIRMCGSTIGVSVTITGATRLINAGDPGVNACTPNTITGTFILTGNTGGLDAIGNHITGITIINGNSGPGAFPGDNTPRISGNTSTAAIHGP